MFEWNDELSVKVDSIDAQHQNLLALMRQFAETSIEQADASRLVLNQLVEATVQHFKFEENKFTSSDYPNVEKHLRIHENLLGKLNEFAQMAQKDLTDELKRHIVIFLEAWLIGHIREVDQSYSKYVNANSRHASA